jgi:geranylgeranyl diphosphate synthase type II
MSIEVARAYLYEQGHAVSRYLQTIFPEHQRPVVLFQAMNYSLLGGGKRLRPVLCLAAARAFGVPEENVMPAAAAVELIHCYSLIHDDLPAMDNDDLRRGKPTNHKVFGEAMALLAGDALLTYAFEQLSQPLGIPAERQLRMVHILAHAAGCYGMVGGQAEDILQTGGQGDEETLAFIHLHKTAKLITAAVEMGGLFADVGETELTALRQYGTELGMAFQMMDDVLDVTATTAELGKPAGSDERLDKLTYPRLFGIDETRRRAEAAVQRAIASLEEAGIGSDVLVGLAAYVVERRQ